LPGGADKYKHFKTAEAMKLVPKSLKEEANDRMRKRSRSELEEEANGGP
jgi:hypothetical protein